MPEPAWLHCRARRPDAALRLYCFPPAGGSSGEYLAWTSALPSIEVWGLQPPGRGERLDERPFTSLGPLVDSLVADVEFRPPFALFGHSLGALVAYETARRLQESGRDDPGWVFVSAHRAPHLPHVDQPIHHLPDDEFLRFFEERYPPLPPELLADSELVRQVLATHRADLAVFETYRHVPGPPLTGHLVAIGGIQDHFTGADLALWRPYTTGTFDVHMIPGDHFLLRSQRADLVRVVTHHCLDEARP